MALHAVVLHKVRLWFSDSPTLILKGKLLDWLFVQSVLSKNCSYGLNLIKQCYCTSNRYHSLKTAPMCLIFVNVCFLLCSNLQLSLLLQLSDPHLIRLSPCNFSSLVKFITACSARIQLFRSRHSLLSSLTSVVILFSWTTYL